MILNFWFYSSVTDIFIGWFSFLWSDIYIYIYITHNFWPQYVFPLSYSNFFLRRVIFSPYNAERICLCLMCWSFQPIYHDCYPLNFDHLKYHFKSRKIHVSMLTFELSSSKISLQAKKNTCLNVILQNCTKWMKITLKILSMWMNN